MITRLRSLTRATAFFHIHELPAEAQEPALRNLVIPRVMSDSMEPTLQAQDGLELGPADGLRIGDLVVFRQDSVLACHRLEHMDHQHLYTKGDACTGPPERILPSDVLGRVTAIIRDGTRLSVPPPLASPWLDFSHIPSSRAYIEGTGELVRSLLRKGLSHIARLPVIGRGVRRLAIHISIIDVLEESLLRSFPSYVKRRTLRLSHIHQLHEYLCAAYDDLAPIALVIRVGPLYLGTCHLAPWSLQIRPAAAALDLATHLEQLQPLLEGRPSAQVS